MKDNKLLTTLILSTMTAISFGVNETDAEVIDTRNTSNPENINGDTYQGIHYDGNGGAIIYDNADNNHNITSATFDGNSAVNGGAIYNEVGNLTIKGSTFTNNTVSESGKGGDIYNAANLTFENNGTTGNLLNSGLYNTGSVTNNGTLTGNIINNIAGGSNTFNNYGTITGSITNEAGTFSSAVDTITGNISNSGTLNLSGSSTSGVYKENNNVITGGSGSLTFTGNVENKKTIEQNSVINTNELKNEAKITATTLTNSGVLTSSADNIDAELTNNGTYNVTGGAIAKAITGGIVKITENTDLNDASYITDAGTVEVSTNKNLNVLTGSIAKAITGSGKVVVAGTDVSLTAAISTAVLVNTDKTLTVANASNLQGEVENNGTLKLGGNTLNSKLSGTGKLQITENSTHSYNEGTSKQGTLTVDSTKKFTNTGNFEVTTALANSGEIANNGKLTLSGASEMSNAGTISGTGELEIKSTVTNNADKTITQNKLTIVSGKELINNGTVNVNETLSNSGTITNNSELNLTGASLKNEGTINGSNGTLNIKEETSIFTNTSGKIITQDTISVQGGKLIADVADLHINTLNNTGSTTKLTGGINSANRADINFALTGNGTTEFDKFVKNKKDQSVGTIKITSNTGDFVNDDSATISAAIINEGTLTSNASKITGDINNNGGTYNITGGAISNAITKGIVNINGDTSVSNASNLMSADTINNTASKLTVTGGNITKSISGANGTTVIDGTGIEITAVSAAIQNKITINSGKDLTVASATNNLANTVNNAGTLNIKGGTISNAISNEAGLLKFIEGDSVISAAVNQKNIEISEGSTLQSAISSLTLADNQITNDGTLTLTGNTNNGISIVSKTAGKGATKFTGILDNNAVITQKTLTVDNGAKITNKNTLTADLEIVGNGEFKNSGDDASLVGSVDVKTASGKFETKLSSYTGSEDISNNGTVTLEGSSNENAPVDNNHKISGTGSLAVKGVVNNTKDIEQTGTDGITIDGSNGILISNADNIKSVVNNALGKLKITGGEILHAIKGAGSTVILGNSTLSASVNNAVTINEDAKLTTANASLIKEDVTNNGTLEISADTLSKNVTGGKLSFIGDAVNESTGTDVKELSVVSTKKLTNSGTISVSETLNNSGEIQNNGILNLTGGGKTYANAGTISKGEGTITAKLDVKEGVILNNSGTITQKDVTIGENAQLNNIGDGAIIAAVTNNGTLSSAVNKITGSVENKGELDLSGAASVTITEITDNTGITKITAGSVDLTGINVTQKSMAVNEGGSLTAAINKLILSDNKITNDGSITLVGAAGIKNNFEIAQSEGKTNGTVTLQNEIENNKTITAKTITADTNSNITNKSAITGNVVINTDGKFVNSGNNGVITGTVTNNGTLESLADKISGAITNTNGTYNVLGGVVSSEISGGILNIKADTSVSDAGNLLADTIYNEKSVLTLTGGELSKAITGGTESKTVIDNTIVAVVTNGSIANAIEITDDGTLSTSASNITGTVSNSGKLVLTAGDITKQISGTGELEVQNTGTVAKASVSEGTLTVKDSGKYTVDDTYKTTVTNKLDNNGEIALNGENAQLELNTASSMQNDGIISGAGTLIINTALTNSENASISSVIDIENGSLNSKLADLGTNAKITNNGAMIIAGGEEASHATNAHEIKGSGTASFSGYVDNTADIELSSATGVTNTGVFKSNANNMKSVMTNSGTYEVSGGAIGKAINNVTGSDAGKTLISGTGVTVGADINNLVEITGSASAEDAAHFKNEIDNKGALTLSGGILGSEIKTSNNNGALTISGSVTANADIKEGSLTVTGSGNSLTINNGKKVTVTSSLSNSGEIKGEGTFIADGELTNSGKIYTAITVNEDKSLTSDVSGVNGTGITADITNNGTLTLNGGDAEHVQSNLRAITGSNGSVEFSGFVENNAAINQKTIINNGTLIADVDDLTVANDSSIKNNGTLNLNDGILSSAITSEVTGSKTVLSDVTLDAAKLGTSSTNKGSVEIAENASALMSGSLAKSVAGDGTVKVNTDGLNIETDNISVNNLDLNGNVLNISKTDNVAVTNLNLNNGTLNMSSPEVPEGETGIGAEGVNYTTLNVGKLNGSGNIKIDASMSRDNHVVDNLSVNSVGENTKLNISTINVREHYLDDSVPVDETTSRNFTAEDYVTLVSGNGATGITYKFVDGTKDTLKVQADNYVYEFTKGTTDGKLDVKGYKTEDTIVDFVNRENDTIDTFSLNMDTQVTDADATGGTTSGTGEELTININHGVTLTGNTKDGMTVSANDTLNINGEMYTEPATGKSTIQNYDNALINNGTLKVSDVTFTENNSADIKNDKILELSGNNEFNTGITMSDATIDQMNAGKTKITDGETTLKQGANIKQNEVEISSGATLNANATDVESTLKNNGTVNFSGDDGTEEKGTITKDITGNGIININNDTHVGTKNDTTEVNVSAGLINVKENKSLTNYGHIEGALKVEEGATVYNQSENTIQIFVNDAVNNVNDGLITKDTNMWDDASGHFQVGDDTHQNITYTNNGKIDQDIITIGKNSRLINGAYNQATNKGILIINETLNLDKEGTIQNNGNLYLNGSNMQSNGTIEGTGKTIVDGSAKVSINGTNSQITQKIIQIVSGGELNVKADKITTTEGVENHGKLAIEGTTAVGSTSIYNAANTVSNSDASDGEVIFKGNVENNANITQNSVVVGVSGTYPVAASVKNNADIVASTFTNNDTFENGTSGTIEAAITNNGSLTSNANNIKGTVNNALGTSEYTVTGGSISYKVSGAGKTIIDGTVEIADTSLGDADNTVSSNITVNSGASLKTNAGKIGHAVINNGTVELKSGILGYKIEDDAATTNSEVKISGAVEANANVTTDTLTVNGTGAKLTIDTGKTVQVDNTLANSTEIENKGTLRINAATSNGGTISGIGTLDLDNNLSTTGDITQGTIEIASNTTLTNNANNVEITDTLTMDGLTSKITNGGNLILSGTDMDIDGTIDGEGTLKVTKGSVENNGSITQDKIEIAAKTLTPATNPKFVSKLGTKFNVTTIDNQNKLELTGGTGTGAGFIENTSIITGRLGSSAVGETTFKGKVKNTKAVTQETVNNEGEMENTALITANIVNTGIFTNKEAGAVTGDVKTSNEFTTAADKVTGGITNSATLNLTGASDAYTTAAITLIDGIEGATSTTYGTLNITEGKVDLSGLNDGAVQQKTIKVYDGADLKAEIADIVLKDTNKTITNDGNLVYIGGTSTVVNENNIVQSTGETNGSVTLQKKITNNADITAKTVTVDTNAEIKNAGIVTATSTNDNDGFINKSTFENTTGSIVGNVINENSATLTSAVDKITGAVDNAGELNLKGGTAASGTGAITMAITKITNDAGTTNIISGIVNNTVDIEQKTVSVASGATLNNASHKTITVKGTADNEGFVNNGTVNNIGKITNDGTDGVKLTNKGIIDNSGTIESDIVNTGTNAKITNTGNIYKVTSNTGEIETIAAGLKDTVASNGTLKLNAGASGDEGGLIIGVTGTGETYIQGDVTVINGTGANGSITQKYIEVQNGTSETDKITLKNNGGTIKADTALVDGEYAVLELENAGTTDIGYLTVDKGTLKLIDGAKLTTESQVKMTNNANLELSAQTKDVNFYSDLQPNSSYSIVADSDNGWKVTIDSDVSDAKSIKVTDNSILDLGSNAIESMNKLDDEGNPKTVTAGNNSTISLNALDTTVTPNTPTASEFKANISGDSYKLNINNDTLATEKLTLNTTISGANEIDVKNGALEIVDSTDIGNTPINLKYTYDNATDTVTSVDSAIEFNAADTINLTSDIKGIDAYDSVTGAQLSNTTNHKVYINKQVGADPTSGLVKVTSAFDNVAIEAQAGELWLANPYALKDTSTLDVKAQAVLNAENGNLTKYSNNLTLEDKSHIKFDAHMTKLKTDNFSDAVKNGTVILDEFNPINANWIVHNSARIHLKKALGIDNIDYSDEALQQKVYVKTPIRKMNGTFNPNNDTIQFVKTGDEYEDFNSAIFTSSVAAQIGGYLTQLDAYNQALTNLDMYALMTPEERQAAKFANKYAASDSNLIFTPLSDPNLHTSGWLRPYSTFENVKLKYGPKVSNVAYGTFAGVESGLYDLGKGWDANLGIYAGYNGSHQAYQGNSIYQNGATLGVVGMAFKNDFFAGATINASDNLADASNMYGKEDFNMVMSGAAIKGGYNWQLAKGKFIIQPSFQTSYSFVNTFNYTNAAGVKVHSDPLHAIQIEPQIKFIGNLKHGWQPYAHLSGVWNILDRAEVKANDVSLPEINVRPYARYGFGVRKTFGDRVSGFFQTFFTSGGRNGMGLQFGFKIQLGESKKKPNIKPENQEPTANAEKKYITKKA